MNVGPSFVRRAARSSPLADGSSGVNTLSRMKTRRRKEEERYRISDTRASWVKGREAKYWEAEAGS